MNKKKTHALPGLRNIQTLMDVLVPFCNSRPLIPQPGELIHYALLPKSAEYKVAFMLGTSAAGATFAEMPGIPWPLLDRPFTMLHYRQTESLAEAYAAAQRLECFAYLLRLVPSTVVSDDIESAASQQMRQTLSKALPAFPTQAMACIMRYLGEPQDDPGPRRENASPPREQRVLVWSTFDAPTTSVIYDLAVCNIIQAICAYKSCAYPGCGERTAGFTTTCVPYDSQARQLAPMFSDSGASRMFLVLSDLRIGCCQQCQQEHCLSS